MTYRVGRVPEWVAWSRQGPRVNEPSLSIGVAAMYQLGTFLMQSKVCVAYKLNQ